MDNLNLEKSFAFSKLNNFFNIGVFCFIFLMLFPTSIFAKKNKDEQKIIQVIQQQQTAWNNGDLIGFMQGYWHHDSLQFITFKGIINGWEKMLNRYQINYPDKATMGKLEMKIVKIEKLNRHYYLVIGNWKLQREKDAPSGYFSLLFKKINQKWLIVKDHTS